MTQPEGVQRQQQLEETIAAFVQCRNELDEVKENMANIRAQLLTEQRRKMRIEYQMAHLREVLEELEGE